MAAVHYRIHLKNTVTWCGRTFGYPKAQNPDLTVETISERVHMLTSVRYKDGQIDRTPLTPSERQEIETERARLKSAVTCKACRSRVGWK